MYVYMYTYMHISSYRRIVSISHVLREFMFPDPSMQVAAATLFDSSQEFLSAQVSAHTLEHRCEFPQGLEAI